MANIEIIGVLETYTVDEDVFAWAMREGANRGIFADRVTGTGYLHTDLDLGRLADRCLMSLPTTPTALTFAGDMPGGIAGFVQQFAIDGAVVGIATIAEYYREVVCVLIDANEGLLAADVVLDQTKIEEYISDFAEAIKVSLGV
jgi:hypothetical protein